MPRRRYLYVALCVIATAQLLFGQNAINATLAQRRDNSPGIGSLSDGSPFDNKVDPALRYLATQYAAAAKAPGATVQSLRALSDGTLYFRLSGNLQAAQADNPSSDPLVQLFVKLTDPSAVALLRARGADIVNVVGDIAIAQVPITGVDRLASLDEVVSIQIPGRSQPLLNVSRGQARVDAVHAGTGGLTQSYKGKGVIVGIIDSGIDWKHPDFSAAPGNTRIRWLLDYANGGQSGQEWTKAQIDATPSPVTEIDGPGSGGHGTHVAGTAVGGGKRNPAYIGMAPESDIIFVKGIRDQNSSGGFGDADVVNGVSYIFNKAKQIGEPAAVNLSLGGHYGPHDGTSLYEQSLSSLVGPGHIIVASAGNEGSSPIHLSYSAAGTDFNSSRQTLWLADQGAALSLVDMWYASGTISVGIAAYFFNSSTGELSLLAYTNPVAPGQSLDNQPLSYGGTTLAKITVDAKTTADPNNGAKRVVSAIQSDGQFDISSVVWSLYTFGSGTFDAWMVTGGNFTTDALPSAGIMPADTVKTVGTPATAKNVICVGSYVTKNTWTDIDGNQRQQQGATVGSISSFSSHGPSRDGRTKPDIVAPGEVILAALSADAGAERATILQGGGLLKLQGTSMAGPHVTGIVALMLERNRYLSYENVLSLLTGTATAAGPANTYGAGKVNALNAMLATPVGLDCATISKLTGYDCDGNRVFSYQLEDAYPNPFNPSTSIGFRLLKSERADMGVYDVLGRLVRTLTSEVVSEGYHTVVWDGKDNRGKEVASGVYFYHLSTPSFSAAHRLVLVR